MYFSTVQVPAEETFSPTKIQAQIQNVFEKCLASTTVVHGPMVGTGVIISGDGYVLTAGHILAKFNTKKKRPLRIVLNDGRKVEAKCLGVNVEDDIALAKITTSSSKPWPHVELAGSHPNIENFCFLLGHPAGVVKNRKAQLRIGRVKHLRDQNGKVEVIVADSNIQPGDSGGPLFDLTGKLIGINSSNSPDLGYNLFASVDVYYRDKIRLEKGEKWGRIEDGIAAGRLQKTPEVESNMLKEFQRQVKMKYPLAVKFIEKHGKGKSDFKPNFTQLHAYFGANIYDVSKNTPYCVGKNSPDLVNQFTKITDYKKSLPLAIVNAGNVVALCCPVSKRHVITKLSLVEKNNNLKCLYQKKGYSITLVDSDKKWDLALLDLGSDANLIPLNWKDQSIVPGTLIFCPDHESQIISWGAISGLEMPAGKGGDVGRWKDEKMLLSKNRGPYPLAVPFDANIVSYQCGGPVLNLKGELIGFSLARKNRSLSLMISSKTLKTLLDKFLQGQN